MNIEREQYVNAATKVGIAGATADALWVELEKVSAALPAVREPVHPKPRFDVANVAYYLGAIIVIGAMGWLMNLAWEAMGGGGLLLVSVIYAACFVAGGRTLWKELSTRVPGGLLFTMAVCMTPLAVYGLERLTGIWPANDPGAYKNFHPYINGSWILMEIATVVVGAVALRFWRFPFITAPIAWALWFLSMDLASLIGSDSYLEWRTRAQISATFGGLMILVAYFIDLRGRDDDYAFWLYLFGLMAFWGGLSSMGSGSEFGKFVYFVINLGLIFCSLLLKRRTFIVFGSIGVFGYLGYLAHQVFENSVLFPFALTLLGLGVIYCGVMYQKRKHAVDAWFRLNVLPHVGGLVPARVRIGM